MTAADASRFEICKNSPKSLNVWVGFGNFAKVSDYLKIRFKVFDDP